MNPEVEYERLSDGCRIRVSGAGGGKSSSKGGKGSKDSRSQSEQPTEAKVSLRSKAHVTVLAVIGEGYIEGFPEPNDALKYIYLDETPIKNKDGTFNFTDIQVDYRGGTQQQSYIPLVSGVESEQNVSVKLTASGGAVVRTLNNSDANTVKIRVMTPLLRQVDAKNNIIGASVAFRIDLSTQGGPFRTQIEDTISGYTTGAYERTYNLQLSTTGPWDIRVTRLTPDSNSTTLANELYWQAFTSVIHDKFRYPNTALLALRLSAEQFKSIPQVALDLNLLKIRLPHNYNAIAKTYTGIFNGTLSNYTFSSNPVWIYYDILTSGRYGLGDLIDVNAINIFALYAIGQYCDERVPDGRGGMEPRFECHCYLQTQDDAFKVIEALATVFRGIAYYAAGSITLVQDRPRQPVRMYTEANVIQEVDEEGRVTSPPFTYSGVAKSAIHTVAMVSYSDRDNFYKQDVEVVDDPESRRRYGFNPIEITAFGCTTKSQARRAGEWLLATERLRTETIVFKVGSEGLLVRPGEIFRVADPSRAGRRLGGRIVTSTATSVTIDAAISIDAGQNNLHLIDNQGNIQTRVLTNPSGQTTTLLTFAPALPSLPPANNLWAVESTALATQLFQCIKVAEESPTVYEITGTTYIDGIYDYVDRDKPLSSRRISVFPDPRLPPLPPSAPQVTETLYATINSSGVKSQLDISWTRSRSPYVDRYRLKFRLRNDYAYTSVIDTSEPRYTLRDVTPGIYDFQIVAINRLGIESKPVATRFLSKGLTTAPSQVTGLSLNPLGDTAILSWDLHPDLDVRIGGRFSIKHTRKTVNAGWVDGVDLAIVAGNTTSAIVPLLNGTYMIKAIDSTSNQSSNVTAVVLQNLPNVINQNQVLTTCQHPNFPGNKQGTIATGSALKLATLDMIDFSAGSWDDHPGLVDQAGEYFDSISGDFDSMTGLFDSQGTAYSVAEQGTYDFDAPIDLGAVFTARVTADMEALKINEYKFFDGAAGTFDDTKGLFDGEDIDSSKATLLIATSQDSVAYTDYQRFLVGDYMARAFKFRLLLESGESFHNVQINKLCVTIDMPDRVETGVATTLTGATTIGFSAPFRNIPNVGVAIQNGNAGDYIQMGTISSSGFVVTVKNSANVNVARSINWYARGYGRQN